MMAMKILNCSIREHILDRRGIVWLIQLAEPVNTVYLAFPKSNGCLKVSHERVPDRWCYANSDSLVNLPLTRTVYITSSVDFRPCKVKASLSYQMYLKISTLEGRKYDGHE